VALSEKSKIVLPILLIAGFVFSTFGWIYGFQNYEMRRIIEAERLLDQVNEGMHEINRTIQSGILTLDEKYAVQAARHSLRVLEMLNALERLHPEEAGAIRRMYLEHYVKGVSINSIFLEKRLDEGRSRLADLEMSYSKMNAEIERVLDLRISHYRNAVSNINMFMGVTSVIFAAVLALIAGLFMHYGRKRREAEKALIEAEKMASLGILSAGVAHEIRNPLTIILHGVEQLDSSTSVDSRRHEVIDGIRQAVQRADGIIKGLLTFSDRPSAQDEMLDALSVLEESLLALESERELRNIRIEREFPPDAPKIRGDHSQLRQVFLNILVNAVEAMPVGGTLRVGYRITGSDSLMISFIDTGMGIPEAEIGRVEDPFFTTKQKSGNIGLGLSVAKGIIEGYGGTIKIESMPGKGTAVTITLPAD
jgi:signal transduction histidine kinase